MIHPTYSAKTPADDLDYSMDFSAWLDTNDGISSYTVTATPSGLTLGEPVVTGSVVTAWASGGTAGQLYEVAFAITTAAGRVLVRSVSLPVLAGL